MTTNSRFEKCQLFWDAIIPENIQQSDSSYEDYMFKHILDCIGALTCLLGERETRSSTLTSCKRMVFWKTIRAIAEGKDRYGYSNEKCPLDYVLSGFPDDSKQTDGRMWLPLHFAVALSDMQMFISLSEIETIFTADPMAVKLVTDEFHQMNPCHLAAMNKKSSYRPRLETIRQLQIYYPQFGTSLAYNANTPLHLAVKHADNLEMVRELIRFCPAALDMVNAEGNFPLHLAVKNAKSIEVVRELVSFCPAALDMVNSDGDTPLHLAAAKYSKRFDMVQELARCCPAAVQVVNASGNTPLHLLFADYTQISLEIIQELIQLYPAALEIVNEDGNTPLHLAVQGFAFVEVIRELVRLNPAALSMENDDGFTPVSMVAAKARRTIWPLGKLEVLLEAAPEAVRVPSPLHSNNFLLHHILSQKEPKEEVVSMMVIIHSAYREAVNFPNDDGILPIHYAAQHAPFEVMKAIAEDNISNLSVIVPIFGSVAHLASQDCSIEKVRYIHSMMPQLLLSLDAANNTPLHYLVNEDEDEVTRSLRRLISPLSEASDVLRFLLRHYPSMATARNSEGETLYDRIPAKTVLFYARRLLLMAGASSLYPGVLQEMNYSARRHALLLFYSSSTEPNIFTRIRHAAGDMSLMRTVISYL